MSARGLVLAGILVAPTPALAITCTLDTTAAVSFGTYTPSAHQDTAGALSLDCRDVDGAAVTLELSAGSASGFSPRTLARIGGGTLAYNLFLDPSRSVVWGDGTGGSASYGPVTPPEGELGVPVYARIPSGQSVASGVYSDLVIATITF